jgi:eukaryotic-like serine/threonine-protein kinase
VTGGAATGATGAGTGTTATSGVGGAGVGTGGTGSGGSSGGGLSSDAAIDGPADSRRDAGDARGDAQDGGPLPECSFVDTLDRHCAADDD